MTIEERESRRQGRRLKPLLQLKPRRQQDRKKEVVPFFSPMTMTKMLFNAHRSRRYMSPPPPPKPTSTPHVCRTTTLDANKAEYLRRLANAMQSTTLLLENATDAEGLAAQNSDTLLMLKRTVCVDSMQRLVARITAQMHGGATTPRSLSNLVLTCEVLDAAVQMLDSVILSRVKGVRFLPGDDRCLVYAAFEHIASRTDGRNDFEVWLLWKGRDDEDCRWNIRRIRHLQVGVLVVYSAMTFNFVCMFLAQLAQPLFPPDRVEAMFRHAAHEMDHFRRTKEFVLFAPSTIALALVLRCNADDQDLVNGFISHEADIVPDAFFQFRFPFADSDDAHAGLSTQLLNVDLCLVVMDDIHKV